MEDYPYLLLALLDALYHPLHSVPHRRVVLVGDVRVVHVDLQHFHFFIFLFYISGVFELVSGPLHTENRQRVVWKESANWWIQIPFSNKASSRECTFRYLDSS